MFQKVGVCFFILVLLAGAMTAMSPQESVQATAANDAGGGWGMPSLDEFTATVRNGVADQVVGVYVARVMALQVVQQGEDAAYVSDSKGVVTQFKQPKAYGVIGLLAHNHLEGARFYSLHKGSKVVIIYGDGKQVNYQVDKIERYQAVTPSSPTSAFITANGGLAKNLTAAEVFKRVYTTPDTLVFQTCIAMNAEPSWGRVFYRASRYLEN